MLVVSFHKQAKCKPQKPSQSVIHPGNFKIASGDETDEVSMETEQHVTTSHAVRLRAAPAVCVSGAGSAAESQSAPRLLIG